MNNESWWDVQVRPTCHYHSFRRRVTARFAIDEFARNKNDFQPRNRFARLTTYKSQCSRKPLSDDGGTDDNYPGRTCSSRCKTLFYGYPVYHCVRLTTIYVDFAGGIYFWQLLKLRNFERPQFHDYWSRLSFMSSIRNPNCWQNPRTKARTTYSWRDGHWKFEVSQKCYHRLVMVLYG